MSTTPTFLDIKAQWNDVLDTLESRDRVAWLVFFDGRLVSLDGALLKLDFSDANKFSGAHDYGTAKREKFRPVLESVLFEIFKTEIQIIESS